MKTASVPARWSPERLDVRSLARSAGRLEGFSPLELFERLAQDLHAPDAPAADTGVRWEARAELRPDSQGRDTVVWLHVRASATVPLQCQRCLGPVDVPLGVDRWFRFVADEATAEAEDDESEEDVLVLQPSMSLFDLIEDELLMALPLVPMHGVCPGGVVSGPDGSGPADEPPATMKPNPFAALARLKK